MTDEPKQVDERLPEQSEGLPEGPAPAAAAEAAETPPAVPPEPAPAAVEPAAEETAVEEARQQPPAAEEPATAEPAAAVEEPAGDQGPAVEEPMAQGEEAAQELEPAKAVEPAREEEPKSENMNWYILKVQSNREDSIREGLLRRVAIAGLGRYFGEVIVPTEKVTEFKGGKKRVTKRKLYPGYLVVHMEINDDTWYLVRDTPGIGDFTGAAGRPAPMLPHEIARIVAKQEEKSEKAPKLKIGFRPGDQVKINEGTFENFEGEVESIDQTNGRVTVMINIFGRSTPVELEYWQIGAV